MTNHNAVATTELLKRYGSDTALDRVDLRVPDGSVYVLIGANGSGKSTLIRLLMNLEGPDAGKAEVLGLDPFTRGPEVRALTGYVPERHGNGYRWMKCGRLLRHMSAYFPSWDHAYADELTRAFDLSLAKTVGNMSKGEARRLHLVMALAHRPPLLLLDEPTDGLDAVVRKRVLTILTGHMADSPTTMLISTHQAHEVESLADQVGVMHKGRMIAQMPRDELKRTVRRYRVELPDGWTAPAGLGNSQQSISKREVQWTLVGEERDLVARLTGSGAHVQEVATLGLEEATLALLPEEVAR